MQIFPVGSRPTNVAPAKWFTGDVRMDPIIAAPDPAPLVANTVSFAMGARTHWHTHDLGQVLHVTQGAGYICLRGGTPQPIRAGDTVWIPADIEHWHGAGPQNAMTHIAMQASEDGDETHWLDPVTDDDYV